MPDLTKEQLYIILGIIGVVLIGCVIGLYNQNMSIKQSSPDSSLNTIIVDKPAKSEINDSIFVHINGAVGREGVYRLNKGDRLIDLLKLCGAAFDSDLDNVNLAETLTEGQKIYIPKKSLNSLGTDQGRLSTYAAKSLNAKKTVNINRANEKELDSLPGIGPATAKRIVDHRNEKGMFSSIEELKEVQGISEKKFNNLKGYISVN